MNFGKKKRTRRIPSYIMEYYIRREMVLNPGRKIIKDGFNDDTSLVVKRLPMVSANLLESPSSLTIERIHSRTNNGLVNKSNRDMDLIRIRRQRSMETQYHRDFKNREAGLKYPRSISEHPSGPGGKDFELTVATTKDATEKDKKSNKHFRRRFENLLRNGRNALKLTKRESLTNLVIDANSRLRRKIGQRTQRQRIKKTFKRLKAKSNKQRSMLRALSMAESQDSNSMSKESSSQAQNSISNQKMIEFDDQWKVKRYDHKSAYGGARRPHEIDENEEYEHVEDSLLSPYRESESNIPGLREDMISLNNPEIREGVLKEESGAELAEISEIKQSQSVGIDDYLTPDERLKRQIETVRARIEYYRKDRVFKLRKNKKDILDRVEEKIIEKRGDLGVFSQNKKRKFRSLIYNKDSKNFRNIDLESVKSRINTEISGTRRAKSTSKQDSEVTRNRYRSMTLDRQSSNLKASSGLKVSSSQKSRTRQRRGRANSSQQLNESFSKIVDSVQKSVINLPNNFTSKFKVGRRVIHKSDEKFDENFYQKNQEGYDKETDDKLEELGRRIEHIEEDVDKYFFLKEKNLIEKKIASQSMKWVGSEEAIAGLREGLDNLKEVRSNDRHLYRLYSTLLDLPFFRTFTKEEAITTFSNAVIKRYNKGDIEKLKEKERIIIVLRGCILVGEKPKILPLEPQDLNLEEIKDQEGQEVTPRENLREKKEYKDVYFEIEDGDYVSPHIFKFFVETEEGRKGRLSLKFKQETFTLEISLNEQIEKYLAKHYNADYFNKIDYLWKHAAFFDLSMATLKMICRSMYNKVYKYGDVILETGGIAQNLYIIKNGTVTVVFRLDDKDLKDNSDPDALLSMEQKAFMLVSNAVQHDLPLKNFKGDSMYIDTLYADNIFGSYFLLKDWKESLKEEIEMSLKNAYTVLIENSEAELYVIPREILQHVSKFERPKMLEYVIKNDIPSSADDYLVRKQIMKSWIRYQSHVIDGIDPRIKGLDNKP